MGYKQMLFRQPSDIAFFFNGLERQSKQLIWKSMGVPITFDVYQRVIGSLVSILIMTMAFMLRGAIAGD